MLLVCDGCVEVNNKSTICMLVWMRNKDRLIERNSWYLRDVMDQWFNNDKNRRVLLVEKKLDRRSTQQQRMRVPTAYSEGMRRGTRDMDGTSPASELARHVLWLLCLLLLLLFAFWLV